MESFTHRLLIKNAAQVVRICKDGQAFKVGKDMDNIELLENASIIVDLEGKIEAVIPSSSFEEQYRDARFEHVINAEGKSVVPGFVDGHTHPVWAGDRVHEFAAKLAGATYMDIHKMGGGIGFTVRHTRAASEETLLASLLQRMSRMIRQGTTTAEAKSGYGLELETEVKMLRVLHKASESHPLELSSTYLGAHSVPKDRNITQDEYAREIVEEHLPAIIKLKQEGQLSVENVDVFHEKGVFETESTRRILEAGRSAGLAVNFHGDELTAMASGELGAEPGVCARAISHLERISEEGMQQMAAHHIAAVLLPTTAYILRLEQPPARRMIELGVPVALGSDFNPNAHCLSMPMVMNLACVNMKMTMNEALVAATINSAFSVGRGATHGSIEKGKAGDFVIVDSPSWEHAVYELGDPPIGCVIKRGRVVYSSSAS